MTEHERSLLDDILKGFEQIPADREFEKTFVYSEHTYYGFVNSHFVEHIVGAQIIVQTKQAFGMSWRSKVIGYFKTQLEIAVSTSAIISEKLNIILQILNNQTYTEQKKVHAIQHGNFYWKAYANILLQLKGGA